MPAKLKVLTAFLLLTLSLAAHALERTELLPANAQTYIRVSNTTDFWTSLQQSSIGKLWADQQFQNFLGNPAEQTLEELFFDGEPTAEDQVFLQQLKMLSGEVVMGIDLKEEEPFIIASMTDADFQRSLEMDAKLAESLDDTFKILKDSFQGVELIQHINGIGTPEEQIIWQAHVDNTFLLGFSREWVEKSIVQLKQDKISEPKGNPTMNLNLPVDGFIQLMIEEEQSTAQPMDMEGVLEALGMMSVQHFSLALELKQDEMVIDSNLRISDLSKGLLSILDVQPSKLPTVTFIPENIASLEVGRFNLLRFWQEIPVMITAAMPEAKPQFDMMVGMLQQQAGINLEQDLLANLDTQYLSYTVAEENQQTSIIALGLKDAAAFKLGLETAMASPGLQPMVASALETELFLDHTIYTVIGAEPGETVAFGVAADHLVYGQPDALRQLIRSASADNNNGLEQTQLVKGLREHVPSRAFGFGAIDWKKNMDAIVREFSKPEISVAMQQSWAKSGSPLPPPDFSKLPSADHIAEFFNVSYQYAETTENGLHQRIILKY